MNTCKLSIVIITLNEEDRLPRLLDDLARQSFTDFEIIHVDSRSSDATVQISKSRAVEFPRYRVVEMDSRGVSLGRNTGAAAACGDRILFLDADTRLDASFLSDAVQELEDHNDDVGIVLMSARGLSAPYHFGFAVFNLGIRITRHFYPTAIGACLFSTREVHGQLSGFDEDIELCEDCDYVLRASNLPDRSFTIIAPKFHFDPRRLDQDGFVKTGLLYLKANLRRFFFGEMRNREIPYRFGHYE